MRDGFGIRGRDRAVQWIAAAVALECALRGEEGAVMGMEGVVERATRPARVSELFLDLAGVEKMYRMCRPDYPALCGIDLPVQAPRK
jgi:hypothetical protein